MNANSNQNLAGHKAGCPTTPDTAWLRGAIETVIDPTPFQDIRDREIRSAAAKKVLEFDIQFGLPGPYKTLLEQNPHFFENLKAGFAEPTASQPSNAQNKPAQKPAQNAPETHLNPAPNPPADGNDGGIPPAANDSAPAQPAAPAEPPKSLKDFKRPPRAPSRGPVSILNQLPPQTQDRILALLDRESYRDVADTLAKPEPEGISLTVSIDALKRFYDVHQVRREAEHQTELLKSARALLDSAATGDEFAAAAIRIVKMRLLETASMSGEFSMSQLFQLTRMLHHQRQADLAERRLALAEKKLNSPKGRAPASP